MKTLAFGSKRKEKTLWPILVVAIALTLSLIPLPGRAIDSNSATGLVGVIVRETAPDTNTAENFVTRLGGTVVQQLSIIGGFNRKHPGFNIRLAFGLRSGSSCHPSTTQSSSWPTRLVTTPTPHILTVHSHTFSAPLVRRRFGPMAIAGGGVDVALIDSGVVPVAGLSSYQKVINGPDLSFESQSAEMAYLDTYGHGTHMACIIAGETSNRPPSLDTIDDRYFTGLAPDSRNRQCPGWGIQRSR